MNLLSFLCGAGFVWTSPFVPKLNGDVDPDSNPLPSPTTPLEDSLITSLHLFGAISSSLITGTIAHKFGKKRTLLIFSVFPTVSNILIASANNVLQFYIARFLLGLGTGCVFSLIPIYVAEISDTKTRSTTSVIIALMNTFSQLLVFIFGPYMTIKNFALISLIPSMLFILTFGLFAPESPHHFILHNQKLEARRSLEKLRGKGYVDKYIMEISSEVEETTRAVSFSTVVSSRVKKALIITLGLLFFQQFSGILPIQCYLQTIFASADGFISADKSAMLAGAVSFVVTMIFTKVIDLFGRKTLLTVSYMGMLVSLFLLALFFQLQKTAYELNSISWLPTVSVLTFLIFFSIGAGPLPWTLIGEIFPANLKAYLSSVAAFFMFLLSSILTLTFPMVSNLFGMAAFFWAFTFFVAIAIVFIIYVVPETKGKTFQEIQSML